MSKQKRKKILSHDKKRHKTEAKKNTREFQQSCLISKYWLQLDVTDQIQINTRVPMWTNENNLNLDLLFISSALCIGLHKIYVTIVNVVDFRLINFSLMKQCRLSYPTLFLPKAKRKNDGT